MQPPLGPPGLLLKPADAFDVPVVVRHSSPLTPQRRPHPRAVDAANATWPASALPAAGNYLVPTTWREVLDAAMRVGRDPTPWVQWSPSLAWAEIAARQMPLFACLQRRPSVSGGSTGYSVEPKPVFLRGTERSGRSAFGYLIGMTMADWVTRGKLNLGSTTHAEIVVPPGAGPAWIPPALPDLVNVAQYGAKVSIVEAKGGRKVGLPELRGGAAQLGLPGLMVGPHLKVLCGTSLEHRLWMTVDLETSTRTDDDGRASVSAESELDEDGDELLAISQSRLLTYFALIALPPGARQLVLTGHSTARRRSTLSLLEDDADARASRDRYEQRSANQDDERMLVGRVPGTGIAVGLSRRLFGACQALAEREGQLFPDEVIFASDATGRRAALSLSEEEIDDVLERDELAFTERQRAARGTLVAAARDGLRRGSATSWNDLVGGEIARSTGLAGYLEAASSDAYIALDSSLAAI